MAKCEIRKRELSDAKDLATVFPAKKFRIIYETVYHSLIPSKTGKNTFL